MSLKLTVSRLDAMFPTSLERRVQSKILQRQLRNNIQKEVLPAKTRADFFFEQSCNAPLNSWSNDDFALTTREKWGEKRGMANGISHARPVLSIPSCHLLIILKRRGGEMGVINNKVCFNLTEVIMTIHTSTFLALCSGESNNNYYFFKKKKKYYFF